MNNSEQRPKVRIKGVKEGLHFIFDDSCDWQTVVKELEHKLEKTHHSFLSGPIVHVFVKLGKREITEEMKQEIITIIGHQGNLLIQSIQSDTPFLHDLTNAKPHMIIEQGIIRSGQVRQFDNDVLFLGDINPGGSIIGSGNIYIMGSLKGLAHAGMQGDETAIIAASFFCPTQLRIANVISRPPDEWSMGEYWMEFAYVKEGKMEIDQLNQLHRIIR